jgi:hypothetical protein
MWALVLPSRGYWMAPRVWLARRQLLYACTRAARAHNDFLWAKILLLHAENLFIDFGAES